MFYKYKDVGNAGCNLVIYPIWSGSADDKVPKFFTVDCWRKLIRLYRLYMQPRTCFPSSHCSLRSDVNITSALNQIGTPRPGGLYHEWTHAAVNTRQYDVGLWTCALYAYIQHHTAGRRQPSFAWWGPETIEHTGTYTNMKWRNNSEEGMILHVDVIILFFYMRTVYTEGMTL
jgi:hypothetical protein